MIAQMTALYTWASGSPVQYRDIARQPDAGHHIKGGFIFVGIAILCAILHDCILSGFMGGLKPRGSVCSTTHNCHSDTTDSVEVGEPD